MAETPEYSGLPYGSNQAVNDVVDDSAVDEELFGEPEDDFTPAGPEEEFLFSPTDRPDEPLTAGAGFGPGADGTRHAVESDADVLTRMAERIAANPSSDPQARAWAAKRTKGL